MTLFSSYKEVSENHISNETLNSFNISFIFCNSYSVPLALKNAIASFLDKFKYLSPSVSLILFAISIISLP